MKRNLFFLAVFTASIAFGQIELEKTFSDDENVSIFTNEDQIMYVSVNQSNQLVIYDNNYNITKTVNVPISSDYSLHHSYDSYDRSYTISKHIFNIDDKFEFIVEARKNNHSKILIINEDGELIKDLTTSEITSYYYPEVYHDPVQGKNKLLITQTNLQSGKTFDEIYLLPTNYLSNKEINIYKKIKFFPNPTNNYLNIVNPNNGAKQILIVDTSGKIVYDEYFKNSSNLKIDVKNFPKGVYFVKIGETTYKFIKK